MIMDFYSLLKAIEAGLMEYWKKWSFLNLNLNVCRIKSNQSPETKLKSIKLIELSSAFFVLGVGMTFATIAFIVEKIFWLYSKKLTPIIV